LSFATNTKVCGTFHCALLSSFSHLVIHPFILSSIAFHTSIQSVSCCIPFQFLRAQAHTTQRIRRWCFLAAGTACLLGGCNPFHVRLGDIRRVRAASFRSERRHCALGVALGESSPAPRVGGLLFSLVFRTRCAPPPPKLRL
jgi:hypothetical protein